MLPSSRERVSLHTSDEDNQAIQRAMEERLRFYSANPAQISTRLHELDEEWDIERAIEMNASALAFTGIAAGIFGDRRWLLLPALEKERHALKALRGDYVGIGLDKARSPHVLSAAAA